MRSSKLFLRILLASFLLLSPVHAPGSGIGKATVIAYEPQAASTIDKSLTATGSTDVVNVTEAGILLEIGILVNTGVSVSVPTVIIDITIDGGTTRSIELYTASLGWSASFKALAKRDVLSDGDTGGDVATLILGTPYLTSLQVAINVTTAADTTGAIQVSVLRGVQP